MIRANAHIPDASRRASSDVAIIGMACTYPGARNLAEFWRNIVGGVDAICDVPPERWEPDVFHDPHGTHEDRVYTRRGGFLGTSFAFNPLRYGTMPRAVEGAEPDQFLVLRTVHEAMEDAGYLHRAIDGERAAFILGRGNYMGAGVGGLLQRGMMTEQTLHILKTLHPEFTAEDLKKIKAEIKRRLPGFGAEAAPGLIPNITTGRVANRLDFMGTNFTVDAACASSLIATELASRDLADGRYDLVLAGGCHVCMEVPFLQVFAAMGALARGSVIRPFDRDCDGTLAGEGVGILVLKRLADAERDGDRIYAVIKGTGTSSDGKAMGVTAPRLEGEVLALRRAYQSAGVDPATVGLIEAHGTGTPVGDPTEVEALQKVFGPRNGGPATCAIGSVKSMIGHTMPAAGAAGLIKVALSLFHRVLPPTLNCRQPIDALRSADSRFYVNTQARPWVHGSADHPRRGGVNAFGFGGVNGHVVLEDHQTAAPRHPASGASESRPTLLRELDSELIVVQARTRDDLRAAVTRLRDYAAAAAGVPLRDVAWTMNAALVEGGHRVAVVASSLADLAAKLTRVAERLADAKCVQIKDSKGIYYFAESPLRDGKLAFLFPGEGAQYLNMMADLCMHFPEVREFFDAADRAVAGGNRYPPSADIFPPPFFSEAEEKAAEERLWKIERATEAVLTADGAMYLLLQRLGIVPHMITGHSAGEWVAMAASGILDFDEFVASAPRLDAVYGGLSDDMTIPRVAMLAVGAGRDEVVKLAGQIDRKVHVANDNCPHQVVVVTELADAEPVMKHLYSKGVFVERLPYDRGYHTPVFTYICEPLRRYFSSLRISKPNILMFSSTTAQPYPTDPAEILDLVSQTFAKPLLFRDTIEAMYAAGARVFLEVGPRGMLTGFTDDALRGRPHAAIATNQPRRSGVTTLHHALAMLAALHVPMNLTPLYERRGVRKLALDPAADRMVDPDEAPGTMRVSLCYPQLVPPQGAEWVQRPSAAPVAETAPIPTVPSVSTSTPMPATAPVMGMDAVLQGHMQVMESFLSAHGEIMQAMLGGAPPANAQEQWHTAAPEPARSPETATATTGPTALEQWSSPGMEPSITEAAPTQSSAGEIPMAIGTPQATPPARRLEEVLVSVVSEKTGYPPDMLDMDLDMEADLGIDSIKRIEILGALQRMAEDLALPTEIDVEAVSKLKTMRQIVAFLEGASPPAAAAPTPIQAPAPFAGRIAHQVADTEITIVRPVELKEDLYLIDHCFDPIVSKDDPDRSRLHIVPLTVALEMMAETAALLMPGQKVVGARGMQSARWIDVRRDAAAMSLAITATCVPGKPEVRVAIRRHDESAPAGARPASPLAESTVLFAAEYAEAPRPEAPELVNRRKPACTAAELYAERRMFHGPRFHGVVAMEAIGENGLSAQLEVLRSNDLLASNPAPHFHIDPCLLDAAGQLVGYWPIEYLADGFMMFPIQIQELAVFRAPLAAGQRARCEVRIREVGQRQVRADFEVIDPEGRVWMRVSGWTDWRFYWERGFYDFWRFPDKGTVSARIELPLPEDGADIECRRIAPMGEVGTSIWENLGAHLLLSERELAQYYAMDEGPRRTEWIFGRAAAKDALRSWIRRHHGLELFPADVEIRQDERGRPFADGAWVAQIGAAPHVSISHKGTVAIAAASRQPVGIDLETIAARDNGFDALAFGDGEREILARLNGGRDEWITRAWSAKEAAGKALGVGLDRGPRGLAVHDIDLQSGDIRVGLAGKGADARSAAIAVRTVRDGEFVMALAVEERKAYERV